METILVQGDFGDLSLGDSVTVEVIAAATKEGEARTLTVPGVIAGVSKVSALVALPTLASISAYHNREAITVTGHGGKAALREALLDLARQL